eukprot:3259686-Amphidinium_carterae.1
MFHGTVAMCVHQDCFTAQELSSSASSVVKAPFSITKHLNRFAFNGSQNLLKPGLLELSSSADDASEDYTSVTAACGCSLLVPYTQYNVQVSVASAAPGGELPTTGGTAMSQVWKLSVVPNARWKGKVAATPPCE